MLLLCLRTMRIGGSWRQIVSGLSHRRTIHEKIAGAGPFSPNAPARRGCRSALALPDDESGHSDHHHNNRHNRHGDNSRVHVHTLLLAKSPAKILSSANGVIIAEEDVRPVALAFAFHESLLFCKKRGCPAGIRQSSPGMKPWVAYWVMMLQALSQPWDTGSAGVTVPMWATYSPSWVGTGARSAPRLVLAVQQQSASVRPVTS